MYYMLHILGTENLILSLILNPSFEFNACIYNLKGKKLGYLYPRMDYISCKSKKPKNGFDEYIR